MGKTVPAIRVTEDNNDLIIKIDKEMLVTAFESHPEIHWFTDVVVPVKIKDKNLFYQKLKYILIFGEKIEETDIKWIESLFDELFLHLWHEGDADFIAKFNETQHVSS